MFRSIFGPPNQGQQEIQYQLQQLEYQQLRQTLSIYRETIICEMNEVSPKPINK